jgi:hypothetical protein
MSNAKENKSKGLLGGKKYFMYQFVGGTRV